ncbi:MAG TPA: TetR/AcrR family transcriptional regulator [Ktedonobacteraceae bacterium]|nr:TetR/AcrR family transcriptional regulator [Ktedonobacteraceae bacterium]
MTIINNQIVFLLIEGAMARTVRPEQYAAKRAEILNAFQRLLLSKGYERMAIQDVLEEVGISSGAFHHYFASRGALLEAFIERIKEESGKPLQQLIDNPELSAREKFQGFFDTLDRLRMERKAEVVRMGRVWYSDSNAVVRLGVAEALARQRAQLLDVIVQQGIQEGSFVVAYPDKAGEVIMALLQGMGDRHAELLFTLDQASDNDQRLSAEIVTTHAAYMDAIERVLGVPAHTFYRASAEAVQLWFDAMREDDQQ